MKCKLVKQILKKGETKMIKKEKYGKGGYCLKRMLFLLEIRLRLLSARFVCLFFFFNFAF